MPGSNGAEQIVEIGIGIGDRDYAFEIGVPSDDAIGPRTVKIGRAIDDHDRVVDAWTRDSSSSTPGASRNAYVKARCPVGEESTAR